MSAQSVPALARHRVGALGLLLASALVLGAAIPAEAQRNCRKGISCGNSGIQFMAAAANHATVLGPYLLALAQMFLPR